MEKAKYGPQQIVLSAPEGDIFWDLPPFITYIAGTSIGTTIFVANPSAEDREYSMIAKLTDANGNLLLEEAVTVYDYTWFAVKSGEFVKLHAELAYNFTNAVLTVGLIERSTDLEVDSVFTYLASPTAAQLPPGFPLPGGGGVISGGFNISDYMPMLMFVLMMGIVVSSFKEEEEAPVILIPPPQYKELPPGRG